MHDDPKPADPDRVSATLERSLKRCSGMVRDYRSKLIEANFKGPEFMLAAEPANEGADEGTSSAPSEEA